MCNDNKSKSSHRTTFEKKTIYLGLDIFLRASQRAKDIDLLY